MKFGVSHSFDCSYLPDQQEQLLVYVNDNGSTATYYPHLIQAGFRRSGDQIYRPHCPQCQACQSLRIPVAEFTPSKSQKRLSKRNQHFTSRISNSPTDDYYPLYERYISERHNDGTMYPPTPAQFASFIQCEWNPPLFVEAYDSDKLIAVAVTDNITGVDNHLALSAMYTFFDPDYEKYSLGTWMILRQIHHAAQLQRQYLYLGYQVDECKKMNYKSQFYPHERFYDHIWRRSDKK